MIKSHLEYEPENTTQDNYLENLQHLQPKPHNLKENFLNIYL